MSQAKNKHNTLTFSCKEIKLKDEPMSYKWVLELRVFENEHNFTFHSYVFPSEPTNQEFLQKLEALLSNASK